MALVLLVSGLSFGMTGTANAVVGTVVTATVKTSPTISVLEGDTITATVNVTGDHLSDAALIFKDDVPNTLTSGCALALISGDNTLPYATYSCQVVITTGATGGGLYGQASTQHLNVFLASTNIASTTVTVGINYFTDTSIWLGDPGGTDTATAIYGNYTPQAVLHARIGYASTSSAPAADWSQIGTGLGTGIGTITGKVIFLSRKSGALPDPADTQLGSCDIVSSVGESCSVTLDGSTNYPRLHVKSSDYDIYAVFESNARNYRSSSSWDNRFVPSNSASYAYRVGSIGDDNQVHIRVTKRTLTVTPSAQSVTYGDPAPSFNPPTVSGFATFNPTAENGNSAQNYTAPSCDIPGGYQVPSESPNVATPVGHYTISCSGGAADDYSFSYSTDTLTVNKKQVDVTSQDYAVQYGDSVPEYAVNYSGFVSGENETNANGMVRAVYGSAYEPTTPVASSPETITVTTSPSADNYSFNVTSPYYVTISKAPLTITPLSPTIVYGNDPFAEKDVVSEAAISPVASATPNLSQSPYNAVGGYFYTVSNGFQNGETLDTISGYSDPTFGSNYSAASHVADGPFPITYDLFPTADNYVFTVEPATLTVAKRTITISPLSSSIANGTPANYPFTTKGWLTGGDTLANTSLFTVVTVNCSSGYRQTGSAIGLYPITCNQPEGLDYIGAQTAKTATLTVNGPALAPTFLTLESSSNPTTKLAGDIQFTVTLKDAANNPLPPKSVWIYAGPNPIGVCLTDIITFQFYGFGCQFGYSPSNLGVGHNTITARYDPYGTPDVYVFDSSTATLDQVVNYETRTATLAHDPVPYSLNGRFQVTAVPSNGAGNIIYTSDGSNSGICSVSSTGLVTILGSGNCGLHAAIETDGVYAPVEAYGTVVIETVTPGTVSISHVGVTYPATTSVTMIVNTNGDAATLVYSVPSTTGVCTVTPTGTVTIKAPGTCTVHVELPANGLFGSASADGTFQVTATPPTPPSGGYTPAPPAQITPTITWDNPAPITTNDALTSTQLNAVAHGPSGAVIPGTYSYSPSAGTKLTAGTHTLSVLFTPTDGQTYTVASKTVTILVTAITATINITNLTHVYDGSPQGATISTTPSNLPVKVTYDGSATVPTNAGSYAVVATSTDSTNPATASATLVISKADPDLLWSAPAAITQGTALGSTQLNADSNIPGTFTYTPGSGTVLNAGNGQTLSAEFMPTDSANYNSGSVSTTIDVTAAMPTGGGLTINFKLGSSLLSTDQLDQIVNTVMNTGATVTIWGYASASKNKAADLKLSIARANAVKAQILKIDPMAKVNVKGFGSTINKACKAALNRCVVVKYSA
jgi:outer membrane protein OmpA-like peptidoglycan-associated protein